MNPHWRKLWLSLFMAPVFEGDEDKTRQAGAINILLNLALLAQFIFLWNNFIIQGSFWIYILVGAGCIGIMLLRRLLWRGQTTLIANLGFVMLWTGLTLAIILTGTVRSPLAAGYLLLVIFAALVSGDVAVLVTVIVNTLTIASLILAENKGWLPTPRLEVGLPQWLIYTIYFLIAAIGLRLIMRDLHTALGNAHRELAERRRAEHELAQYRQQLENLVAERTAALQHSIEAYSLQAEALDAAANVIIITDREGCIIQVNRAFTELTGYTQEEVVGQNPRLLQSGQHSKSFYQEMWSTILAGQVWRGELINRYKDGSQNFEEMTITPVRGDTNEITHFIAIKQNITERKRVERALQQSEERLELALKGADLGWWDWNLRTNLEIRSSRWTTMLGYGPEASLSTQMPWETLIHPLDSERVQNMLRAHLRGETRFYEAEYRMRTRSAGWCWVLSRGQVVERNEQGQPLRMVGTHLDITERKLAEQALRESEARYHQAISTAGAVPYVLNYLTENYDFIGEGIENLTGYLAQEITPTLLNTLIETTEMRGSAANMDRQEAIQHTRSGQLSEWRADYCIRARGGETRWLADASVQVIGEDGHPTGAIGVLYDITERKRLEQQLGDYSRVLSEMYEIISNPSLDIDGQINALLDLGLHTLKLDMAVVGEIVGEEYRLHYGRGAETLGKIPDVVDVKTTLGVLVMDAGNPLAFHSVGASSLQNHPGYQQRQIEAYIGAPLVVNAAAYGILSFSSRQPHQPFTSQEIELVKLLAQWIGSALTRALQQDALVTARDAAEAANRAKSTFLANMSHELRTPLTVVIGYSEMLQESLAELGQSRLRDRVDRIHSSARHLLGVISDVLDLSKIEAGHMQIHPETFLVANLIAEVQTSVMPLVEKNHNILSVDFSDQNPGEIYNDPVRVRQILYNLLSNAAKFTENGHINLRIYHPSTSTPKDQVIPEIIFEVSDSGIGMNEEQLERIFSPFVQADETTTRKFGGTGLGLTISSLLCHLMGGKISAHSLPGQGSTFTVVLPVNIGQQLAGSDITPDIIFE